MKKKTTTTAMGKMPQQYEAIRAGIVGLLKIGEIRCRQECEFDHDG